MGHHIRHRATIAEVEVHVIGWCDRQMHPLPSSRIIAQNSCGHGLRPWQQEFLLKKGKRETKSISDQSGLEYGGESDGEGRMPEEITSQELEMASRNLERMSGFIGERRGWLLGTGGEMVAEYASKTTASLAAGIADLTKGRIELPSSVQQPPELEPSAKLSADRLSKFADFMEQLRQWFASHGDAGLPPESDDIVLSMQASLAVTSEALQLLLGPAALGITSMHEPTRAPEELPSAPADEIQPTAEAPQSEGASEPESLTSDDLGPVAEIDRNARLILEDNDVRPLLQKFKGIVELTPEAKKLLDGFIAEQGIEFGEYEMHRLHDKVMRWLEGTPADRVLVIKISGLYDKPTAYSSYQPKESVIQNLTEAD